MNFRVKILLVFIPLSFLLCFMSNTYSRYVADTTGDLKMSFAQWQILVNNEDITKNTSSSVVLKPVIDTNEYVKNNKIAPSSTGYFDVSIDPSNVDVSFNYNISLKVVNENMPDLMITEYSILPSNYVEGDSFEIKPIEDNVISDSHIYDNSKLKEGEEPFKFKPFTVRVYFKWYEGTNELMGDIEDTAIATSTDDVTLDIEAKIQFRQKI